MTGKKASYRLQFEVSKVHVDQNIFPDDLVMFRENSILCTPCVKKNEHKNLTRIMSYNSPGSSIKVCFNIIYIFGLLLEYLLCFLIY